MSLFVNIFYQNCAAVVKVDYDTLSKDDLHRAGIPTLFFSLIYFLIYVIFFFNFNLYIHSKKSF